MIKGEGPDFLHRGLDGIINSALASAYIAGKSAAMVEGERDLHSLQAQRTKLLNEVKWLEARVRELRGETKGSDLSGEVHDGSQTTPE